MANLLTLRSNEKGAWADCWPLAVLCGLSVTAVGCGDGLVDVQATVTLDGEPLDGASISLVSDDAPKNRSAYGTTDAGGRVTFSTFAANDGVIPGAYKVVVTKAPDDQEQEMDNFDPDNPEDVQRILLLESGNFVPFVRTGLPRVYTSVSETPLSCRIPPDGDLVFDLDSSLGKKNSKRGRN